MTRSDLMWVAGLFEGEGSFFTTKRGEAIAKVQMTDEDVVARAAQLMGCPYGHSGSRDGARKPVYRAELTCSRAKAFMSKLRPHMGERRRHQIDSVLGVV